MESLSFLAGVMGSTLTMFFYLSPIKTFSQIVKHRSTEEFESLPYVVTLLNTSTGMYYGIFKPGLYLFTIVCMVGAVIELVYVVLFLIYAPPKIRAKTAILVGGLNVGFLVAIVLVSQFAVHGDFGIEVLGVIRAGISIATFASPLVATKRVVETKSVQYMPFLLSFCLLTSSAAWTWYSILVQDLSVGLSNGVGVVLGAFQLIIYAIYWKREPSSNNILDDGWQHKHLLNNDSQDV